MGGTSAVPFVEDGQGGVVARWPLAATVSLRVVARFGDVQIQESEAIVATIAIPRPDSSPGSARRRRGR